MKYVFIMNPASGKKRKRKEFTEKLRMTAEEMNIPYDLYFTKFLGDGKRYVKEVCKKCDLDGEKLRIYACGGDGTLNEVVNGAFGFKNAEVGVIPMGTGNDYIRNYGEASDFLNIKRQITGASQNSDVIKYRAVFNDNITEGYCANMFNIGFDCNVVDMTAKIKGIPFVKGSLAYLISVFIILIKKKGADLRIEYEDGYVKSGRILLIAIANGCYCGGGVKGVPYCLLNDGLMDVSVVNDVSRNFFIRLFPSYSKGTHMESSLLNKRDVIRYTKERTLSVTANGDSLRLCTDGEITTQKSVEFSIIKDAFRFIVPSGKQK